MRLVLKHLGSKLVVFSILLMVLGLMILFTRIHPALAEWTVQGEGYLYGTEDVALFSATRRLQKDQDPTQPVIDSELAEQGSGAVFEPVLQIDNYFPLFGRDSEIKVRGQGFIFLNDTRFNHGTLGVVGQHKLTQDTKLQVRYYFAPNLLVGENEVRTPGEPEEEELADEIVTTNFLAAGLVQRFLEDYMLRVYGRYGTRRYNQEFQERNTDFWTIGPHGQWEISKKVKLILGYHYERGLADGRNQPALQDDVSYINHFVTSELEIELQERWDLELAFHYELNNWTTEIPGDPRRGQHEDVYQGDIELLHEIAEDLTAVAGFQGQYRKESFEPEGFRNLNGWVGARWKF